jgi:hypothetical protein
MAYSKAKLKSGDDRVLDHFGYENYQANGLYYMFHLNTF